MPSVDFNCDLGEGADGEAELMSCVTSANIACGGHAGDAETMRQSVMLALRHGVHIGAHPGFLDREHFGRREQPVTPAEAFELVVTQSQALRAIARAQGGTLRHVKPHGALYNQAAREPKLAEAVVDAVLALGPGVGLFALAGSVLVTVARAKGLPAASEVFADRTYRADGSLTSRSRSDALITAPAAAVAQVLRLVREGKVRAVDGPEVALEAETVCVHGDGPHALALVKALREGLAQAGVAVRAWRS